MVGLQQAADSNRAVRQRCHSRCSEEADARFSRAIGCDTTLYLLYSNTRGHNFCWLALSIKIPTRRVEKLRYGYSVRLSLMVSVCRACAQPCARMPVRVPVSTLIHKTYATRPGTRGRAPSVHRRARSKHRRRRHSGRHRATLHVQPRLR